VSNSTTSTMPGSPTAALITVGVGCIIVAIMGFLAVSRRRKNEVKVA
jgi:hypothetical protein